MRPSGKPRPPLDSAKLNELALGYVGRFATTRSKLRAYLQRKLRERGWEGGQQPDLEAIAERFASNGYVDDEAFAMATSRSLTARGYGPRRLDQSLRVAGVEEDDGAGARELAGDQAIEAALQFARRKRLGPFALQAADPKGHERALSAMIRAGHGFGLARTILALSQREEIELESLAEEVRTRLL
jgi:regulatory protein